MAPGALTNTEQRKMLSQLSRSNSENEQLA